MTGRPLILALAAAALTACDESGAPADSAGAGPAGPDRPPAVTEVAAPAPRPAGPLAPGAGCITSTCHAGFATAPFAHHAVTRGDCEVCHRPDQGGHTYPLKRPGDAGCIHCHAVAGNRAHQHAAIDVEGCAACHDPHASHTRFLLTSPSTEVLCYGCHVRHEGRHGHGPFAAGQCGACHEPHESDFAALLRGGAGNEHCFLCHDETRRWLNEAAWVHAPARDRCTTCHDPHASDHPHVLREPVAESCFDCHDDLARRVAGAAAPHSAVFTGDSCANCHDAHASDRPSLLLDRQDVLCLACHDKPLRTADGRMIPDMAPRIRDREFLHGPVKSGDCAACHDAHGSRYGRLLREHFTEAFYAPFDLGDYALCFTCHDSGLVTEARTEALTGFRDGDLNLHFLHVNRERKGRTCRACHDMHGSDQPKHLAETVPFERSGWALPIGFQATTNGGSCAPGCHEPMSYSRTRAVRPPAAAPGRGGAP